MQELINSAMIKGNKANVIFIEELYISFKYKVIIYISNVINSNWYKHIYNTFVFFWFSFLYNLKITKNKNIIKYINIMSLSILSYITKNINTYKVTIKKQT